MDNHSPFLGFSHNIRHPHGHFVHSITCSTFRAHHLFTQSFHCMTIFQITVFKTFDDTIDNNYGSCSCSPHEIDNHSPLFFAQRSPPPRTSHSQHDVFSFPSSPPTHSKSRAKLSGSQDSLVYGAPPTHSKSHAKVSGSQDSLVHGARGSQPHKKRKAPDEVDGPLTQSKRAKVEVLLKRQIFKSRLLVDSLWRMQQERGELRVKLESKQHDFGMSECFGLFFTIWFH